MFLETEICESIARSDYMDLITSLFFFKKKNQQHSYSMSVY